MRKNKSFYEFVGEFSTLMFFGNFILALSTNEKVLIFLGAFFAGVFASIVAWSVHKYIESDTGS